MVNVKPQVDAKGVLQQRFGFNQFRDGQEPVIQALLQGHSALAIFPTGAGKSLCYQLPALMLPGLTLVVSPLLALMKDQIEGLQAKGIDARRLDSSLDDSAYREVVEKIRSGDLKLLFVAPERFSNERFLGLIKRQRISLMAIDEAHCISAWGHNFRPEYLKLARAAGELKVERILALTATATPQVGDDIAAAFEIAPQHVINTGFHRPNLELRVTACTDAERPGLLLQRLRERPPGATIVYVHLQQQAETVAEALRTAGFRAAHYHAGMKPEEREQTQDAFMRGDTPIICATIAFGMGVDKADIRYVYHYHLAKGFESYMQEIGRAGRDGQPAICELFTCPDDCTTLENFIYGDTPDTSSIQSLINEIYQMGDEIDISVHELSRRHDMRPIVVNTLLTHLELIEAIRAEGHYCSDVRFAPKYPGNQLLAQYDANQADFLRQVFNCCQKAKKWVTVDMDKAVRETGHERSVVMRALDSLQEKGLAEVQLTGFRQRFRRLPQAPDATSACQRITETFARHEGAEIQRIHSILEYAGHDGCLTGKILQYFGETVDHCNHCGTCLGDKPARLPKRQGPPFDSTYARKMLGMLPRYQSALGTPRQQARFLCGLSSPAVSAERDLRKHPLAGAYEGIPFARVLQECQAVNAPS